MFIVYSFSIAMQIDGIHIADCFPDIIIPMFVWKYLFFTIYIYIYIYIYIKRELQSACSILAFKRSLFILILHNQMLIKVWNTLHLAIKYWILATDGWNNYYLGHVALFLGKFWHLFPMLILHSFYIHCLLL